MLGPELPTELLLKSDTTTVQGRRILQALVTGEVPGTCCNHRSPI